MKATKLWLLGVVLAAGCGEDTSAEVDPFMAGTWPNNSCEPSEDGAPCCEPQEIVCEREGERPVRTWKDADPLDGEDLPNLFLEWDESPPAGYVVASEMCSSASDLTGDGEVIRALLRFGPVNAYGPENRLFNIAMAEGRMQVAADCRHGGDFAISTSTWDLSSNSELARRCFDADGLEVPCP